ncbi:hypothetical protein BT69DRAFT_1327300 [Atractiella rhizophila]|nr:hypothetical protein BT69DRAFT_1327300 [Atractiella rhizophila]
MSSYPPRWASASKTAERPGVLTSILLYAAPLAFITISFYVLTHPSLPTIEVISDNADYATGTSRIRPSSKDPLSTLPVPRQLEEDRKYLAYLPHSGFHNQRIALQNALLLGQYLNRTVLVPPIWTGAGSPGMHTYEMLSALWEEGTKGRAPFVKRRGGGKTQMKEEEELTGRSFVSWDFVFDLRTVEVQEGISLANRWWGDGTGEVTGMMEQGALIDAGGLSEADILRITETGERYDLLYTDRLPPSSPLISNVTAEEWYKFNRAVSLPTLSTVPERLILFGSLFGSDRVVIKGKPHHYMAKRLIFDHPMLLHTAREMGEKLGGKAAYASVLARVGDGVFKKKAEELQQRLFEGIVRAMVDEHWEEGLRDERFKDVLELLKVKEEQRRKSLVDEKRKRASISKGKRDWEEFIRREGGWSFIDSALQLSSKQAGDELSTRSPLPLPLPQDTDPFENGLSCHTSLHDNPLLSPFNAPFYLATDSHSPSTDVHLNRFYAAFPCLHTLSDFLEGDEDLAAGVRNAMEWRNLQDSGEKLGGLMLPILDGMVAARARIVIPTEDSTFGTYVANQLHEAYMQKDD